MKWVKGVDDLNILIIRAQGIVGVGAGIHMFPVSCRAAACPRTVSGGSDRHRASFCR